MRPAGLYKSHDLITCISRSTDFGLWPDYKVMIFVQGRISRPINGRNKINRKVQKEPQAEAAANPRHQEEKRKSDTD